MSNVSRTVGITFHLNDLRKLRSMSVQLSEQLNGGDGSASYRSLLVRYAVRKLAEVFDQELPKIVHLVGEAEKIQQSES